MANSSPHQRIPNPVVAVVADVLSSHYTHAELDLLFAEHGAPGNPPDGNKKIKCHEWLKRVNREQSVPPVLVLGKLLENFLEIEPRSSYGIDEVKQKNQQRVRETLGKYGLRYSIGGHILGCALGAAAKSLRDLVADRDLVSIEKEFGRALENVETDPQSACTAACALLESLFKVYIEDTSLPMPGKETVKPLWAIVQENLNMQPASVEDEDLRRILSGLSSIVDGIGSLRTHAGLAHGRGRRTYRLQPRHAKLAVHAATTLAVFVLESWFQGVDRAPQVC